MVNSIQASTLRQSTIDNRQLITSLAGFGHIFSPPCPHASMPPCLHALLQSQLSYRTPLYRSRGCRLLGSIFFEGY